jgi:hypothetical protein
MQGHLYPGIQLPISTTMKSCLLSAALLSAALGAPAFSSAPVAQQTIPAVGYLASRINVNSWDPMFQTTKTQSITAGTTRAAVLSLLGSPRQQLAPDVYLYNNCQPNWFVARGQGCVTLLITFAKDRVADMKFVNASAATIIAANLRDEMQQKAGSSTKQGKDRVFAIPNK